MFFADIPRSRLENTYNVNILAMFTLAQLAARQMLKQGSGNIINVGSIQAYAPTFGILDYASTKVILTPIETGWHAFLTINSSFSRLLLS